MFKDYVYEVKDSAGNVIEIRTIPYYHPNYALQTPTQAYRPTEVKWVRTYRTPTTVTYEDGSVHQNVVEKPGPLLIGKANLISDEMIEYTEFFSDGFYVKQYYYAWANPYHDDYIIRVVDIVNNGNLDDNVFTVEMPPKNLERLYFDFYVNNLTPNNKGEPTGPAASCDRLRIPLPGNNPSSCSQPLTAAKPLAAPMICGVDEAGRGPVIGPIVVCGVAVESDAELRAIGVRDSKKLMMVSMPLLPWRQKSIRMTLRIHNTPTTMNPQASMMSLRPAGLSSRSGR